MLSNEISLIKFLDKKQLINYHLYSTKFNSERAICYEIVVDANFKELQIKNDVCTNENILNYAFSLLYKDSPFSGTGLLNYIFGDICLDINKLKASKEVIKSAYDNIEKLPDYVVKFNKTFNLYKKEIFTFLKKVSENIDNNKVSQVFLHFDFKSLKVNNWYEIENIVQTLDDWFIETKKSDLFSFNKQLNNYSLIKSFLPSVPSGDEKNDMQFPSFNVKNRHKVFALHQEDLWTVFYHKRLMRALTVATISIPKGTIYNLQLVPSGDVDEKSIQNFIDKTISIDSNSNVQHEAIEDELSDDIFMSLEKAILNLNKLVLFDITLVQKGDKTNIVLSEISNISRDFLLKNISQQKEAISNLPKLLQVELDLKNEFELKYTPTFYKSFFNIHEKNKQNYKKFLNWLFKLFMGQKNHDSELTSIFIDKIFHEIKTNENVDYLKFFISYKFVQQLNEGGDVSQEFEELGKYCGSLAAPVSHVVGNFEASRICQLKQQVTTIQDVKEFLNEIMLTLTLHRKDKGNVSGLSPEQHSVNYDKAIELLKTCENNEFNQESFIVGFLSSYFKSRRFTYNKQNKKKETENGQE